MANIVITGPGTYRVSDGDTVEIVGNVNTSTRGTDRIQIQQASSDPADYAKIHITISGDLVGKHQVYVRSTVHADMDVNNGVKLSDTQIKFDTPNTNPEVTTHTINLGDNTELRRLDLEPANHSEVTVNTGSNVILGDQAPGEDAPAIFSGLDTRLDSRLIVNIGENNQVYGEFIDNQTNRAGATDLTVDGITIDARGVNVSLNTTTPQTESSSTTYFDNATLNDAATLRATGPSSNSGSDYGVEVYIRGLVHNVAGADSSGLVDVAGGGIVLSMRDDTLHLGGDLSTNDADYFISGGYTETDDSITDTLDFQYVDAAQKQEFIDSFVAAGGLYDPATEAFSFPAGIDVDEIQWTINQRDGTGVIRFRGWEAVQISPLASIACFTRGTVIKTLTGDVAVENLQPGDMVLTMDQGYQPLRWIGSRRVCAAELATNPKLYPVRIPQGAMGSQLPERDLLVSRQHRMLVRSPIAQRMFDTQEVLIAAIKLCAMPGIHEDKTVSEVEYFHMLFDDHQVVYANGAPSESLYTGAEALAALSTEAREEIMTLFPELTDLDYAPSAARQIPSDKHQKKLLQRHAQHEKNLVAL